MWALVFSAMHASFVFYFGERGSGRSRRSIDFRRQGPVFELGERSACMYSCRRHSGPVDSHAEREAGKERVGGRGGCTPAVASALPMLASSKRTFGPH